MFESILSNDSHVCVNKPEVFYYICGGVTFVKEKCALNPLIKNVYHLHFDSKVGEQDINWAPHVYCNKCASNIRARLNGKKCKMPFDGLMISQELLFDTSHQKKIWGDKSLLWSLFTIRSYSRCHIVTSWVFHLSTIPWFWWWSILSVNFPIKNLTKWVKVSKMTLHRIWNWLMRKQHCWSPDWNNGIYSNK